MVNGKGRKMIGIVIPVFNDWESLNRLIRKLNDQSATLEFDFHIFVVDDGSTEPRHLDYLSTTSGISEVQLIRLFGNIGHQRAIAVGLVVASRIEEIEAVVVMDAWFRAPARYNIHIASREHPSRGPLVVSRERSAVFFL